MKYSLTLLLFLFVIPLPLAPAQEQSPDEYLSFTIPKGVPTASDHMRASLKFWLVQIDLYKAHSKDTPAMRPRALKFLEAAIRAPYQQFDNEKSAITGKELLKLAVDLVAEKNYDPLIMMHCSDVLVANGFASEAKKLAARFDRNLKNSDYPDGLQILSADRRLHIEDAIGGVDLMIAAKKEFVELTPAWLAWARTNENWQRPTFDFLIEFLGDRDSVAVSSRFEHELLTNFAEMIKAYRETENSDPWISDVVLGIVHYKLAWRFRGNKMADKVTPEGWKQFENHLSIAAKHFNSAYESNPERPEAAGKMVGIANLIKLETGTEYDWFTRCLNAEVDYSSAYADMLNFRQSRWGGSPEAILEFGEYCAATNRYDTLIPSMYIASLRTLRRGEDTTWPELLNRPGIYDKAVEVLTKLAEDPSRADSSKSQSISYTTILCLSLLADRFEDTAKLFEKLGDNVYAPSMARYGFRSQWKFLHSRAYANLEFETELAAFRGSAPDRRLELKDSQEVNQLFRELLEKCSNPGSKYYLQTWIDRTQIEIDFHSGKWVNLEFDPEFVHWTQNSVHWTFESPHSAVASNEKQLANIHLYHLAEFPGPKEILAETELIASSSYKMPIGISIGSLVDPTGGRLFFGDLMINMFGISHSKDRGNARDAKLPRATSVKPPMRTGPVIHAGAGSPAISKPMVLQLRYWGPEKFEFQVNGQVFPIKSIPEMNSKNPEDNSTIGIGDQHWMQYSGIVRLKFVRIRKLFESP